MDARLSFSRFLPCRDFLPGEEVLLRDRSWMPPQDCGGHFFPVDVRGAKPNAGTRYRGLVRAYRSPQAFLARRVSTKVLCRDGVFVGSCPPARARILGFCSAAGVSFEALAPYSASAREVRMWRDISAHFKKIMRK